MEQLKIIRSWESYKRRVFTIRGENQYAIHWDVIITRRPNTEYPIPSETDHSPGFLIRLIGSPKECQIRRTKDISSSSPLGRGGGRDRMLKSQSPLKRGWKKKNYLRKKYCSEKKKKKERKEMFKSLKLKKKEKIEWTRNKRISFFYFHFISIWKITSKFYSQKFKNSWSLLNKDLETKKN